MILILENELAKAQKALEVLWETASDKRVIVCRFQSQAEGFVRIAGESLGKLILILDGELDPGCGSGKGFLDWMIVKHCEKIKYVQPNSSSPDVNKEMADMCRKALIPVGLPAQIGRKQ